MLTQQVPSYAFSQYADDSAIQAFVSAFNAAAQQFLTNINALQLPIYTQLSGPLLDWVGNNLYGIPRPTLTNTLVSDDVYQRCMTWALYKGDGKQFSIAWLKRRLVRFLNGPNGTDPGVNETYQISVTFGPPNIVYINVLAGIVELTGGAIYDRFQYDQRQFNEMDVNVQYYINTTLAPILQEAINAGVLELPFQYTYVVGINP